MKILCYGDSNTYGYDPASFFGGRYGPDSRWCDLLAAGTGLEVINRGENGRSIPCRSWHLEDLEQDILRDSPLGLLIIMLGTNDILNDCTQQPEQITERMEKLLDFVAGRFPELPVLLLSPPPVRLPVPEPVRTSERLGKSFEDLARRKGVLFCDTALWNPELSADGVHLSPNGHRTFAEKLSSYLRESGILPPAGSPRD